MNVVERAQDGYGRNAVHMKSPRDTEYEVIAKISHRLRAAAKNKSSNYPAYIKALSDNARLWTTLAADLAQQDNQLPQDLRARLFWLSRFTTQETNKLMKNEGDVGILIEVNAAVLQGLRGPEAKS